MRIAQVAPLFESVPPKLYGGTERVVSHLTEELVRQGHEVTLFASGDSETAARLVPGCPRALWQEPDCRETLPHHVRLVELVARQAHQFELIHFHLDYVHFPVVGRLPCPTVTTLHGRIHLPDQEAFFGIYPEVPLVSISDDQRRPVPEANWQATVYHGLPRDLHTLREAPGAYLAFLGRVSPEKGLDKAVEIARRAGMPLRVAARIYPEERPYYEREIEPLLRASPWVEFVGEVGGAAKDAFLGNAYAVLFPIDWAEPFGLVMIEAMACGTPVVAFRRGSVPEVMVDGVTGFVVDDVEGAVPAVERVAGLSRSGCRRVFDERFDSGRMARDYRDVYRRLVHAAPERSRSTPLASRPGRPGTKHGPREPKPHSITLLRDPQHRAGHQDWGCTDRRGPT
jgi:glycosyltransferase involved in cell wall biosynthesis